MKFIRKGRAPGEFKAWRKSPGRHTYSRLRRSGRTKRSVKRALMRDQGHICCYCERRITWSECHVEHFRPQAGWPELATTWTNLLCSCQRDLTRMEPLHCGMRKGSWFDERLLVSPLSSKCEGRFRYTGDGAIHPAREDDEAAAETIRRLGLDIPKLRALRQQAIEAVLDAFETLDDSDMAKFAESLLGRDSAGRFQPFYTTVREMLQKYGR